MPDETKPTFTVNGTEYELPTDLDLGEMCDAERFFGVEFGNQATSGIRMAAALLWIAIKRVDATVTVEDVRALPPEVFASMTTETDARPPEPSEKPPASNEASGGDSSNGAADLDSLPEPTGHPA